MKRRAFLERCFAGVAALCGVAVAAAPEPPPLPQWILDAAKEVQASPSGPGMTAAEALQTLRCGSTDCPECVEDKRKLAELNGLFDRILRKVMLDPTYKPPVYQLRTHS